MNFFSYLNIFLEKLKNQGLLRENKKEGKLNFILNDYLGLRHRKIELDKLYKLKENLFTSSASPLLGGYSNLKESFCNFLKYLYKKEVLLFNTGYAANLGCLSSLKHINSLTIFVDKLAHASIYDGILLSQKPFFRFRHNDMDHLEYLLKTYSKNYKYLYVVTESIFSMDGDISPIKDLLILKEKYNFVLHIDEAHAFGIYGKNLLGAFEKYKESIDIITITFGKALGSFGSAILSEKSFIDFLINTARSYIYSTHISNLNVFISYLNFLYIRKNRNLHKKLFKNIVYFKRKLKDIKIKSISNNPIQPIFLKDLFKSQKDFKDILEKLKKFKVQIGLIRPPTVPKGKERFRISLRADHSKKDIDELIDILRFLKE